MNPQVKIIYDEFKQKGDKVKLENMNKILNLGKVKLTMHKNGFPKGFVMKRKATLRECRYILYRLLGINICTREDFEFPEEYKE